VSGEEPWSGAAGVGWFAAQLDRILGLAHASALDKGLANDLISARDLALIIEDWAKHRAGCGDYFFTVTIHMRSDDQDASHTFTVPHAPEAADFLGKLTRQLALLAGQRAHDPKLIHTLTELTAVATGLTQALLENLGKSAGLSEWPN
jgi:hypothetical protein